ncbi:MAG: hypothetical protein KDK39_06165 [Leptospiraceae bacterium]|nr:hypothetical protein [Leptospiraceae bacterium]
MRFLLSGNLFQLKGPRQLVLWVLALSQLALILHALSYTNDWLERRSVHQSTLIAFDVNFAKPSEPASNNSRSADLLESPESGPGDTQGTQLDKVIIEALHIDLFLFSFYFLFIGSLIIQMPVQSAWPPRLIRMLALSLLLFLLTRALAAIWPRLLLLEFGLGVCFYAVYAGISLGILRILFLPGRR